MISHGSAKARRRIQMLFRVFLFSWLVIAPRIALACPVCFGQNDSPLAVAMNMGIVFMLVIVGAVLVGFASFFIYLMRRARLAAQQSESTASC